MLGCSGLIGRLTSTPWASLVTLVNDDMPSRVADMAHHVGSLLVSLGMVPWRADRALVVVWARLRNGRSRTLRGRWRGSIVARTWPPCVLLDGGLHWPACPYWFLAPNGSVGESSRSVDVADKYTGAGARRGAGSRPSLRPAWKIWWVMTGCGGPHGPSPRRPKKVSPSATQHPPSSG